MTATSTHSNNPIQRIASIDVFRSIAMMAVVVIHAPPFWAERVTLGEWPAIIINQAARFAVPFFFIISGFLLARSVATSARPAVMVVTKQAHRIAIVLLFWSVVYLFFIPDFLFLFSTQPIPQSIYWNFLGLLQHPAQLLHESTRIHLWFMVALLECLLLTIVWRTWLPRLDVTVWVFLFYLIGMATGPYQHSDTGSILSPWLLNLPWTEVSLFFIGWWIQATRFSCSLAWAITLAISGMALHFIEVILIQYLYGEPIMGQDTVFGTSLWAVGIVMALLARPEAFKSSWLESTGKYALGVYVVHLIVLDAVNYFGMGWQGMVWTMTRPLLVFTVSLMLVSYLSRVSWMKRFMV